VLAPGLLDIGRPLDPKIADLRGAYETAPSAKTARALVREGGFIPPLKHRKDLEKRVRKIAPKLGLNLTDVHFSKPGPRMAFGIIDFRFEIPGFKRKDVVKNRKGPTWFLNDTSRLSWRVLVPTMDAFLRGYMNPITKREHSGGAFGVTGSMRLESLRRKAFKHFDRAATKQDWMKLLFAKKEDASFVSAAKDSLKEVLHV